MLANILRAVPLWALVATFAHGQDYPSKTVRIVASYPPGGSIDIVARMVGQRLAKAFGQQTIIDNRPGASGNIGTEYVAKAVPDGYTLLMSASNTFAANTHLFARLPFDPIRDFAPIILVANQSAVLVLHPALPVKNVKALVALAKAHPGKVTFGSGGVGTSPHMSAALFMMTSGVNLLHVPYKGEAPAMLELLGGQIDAVFLSTPSALPYVQSGKVNALGITSLQRSARLPSVPTISEAGLPGFEFRTWLGLVAPVATPKDVIAKLNAEVNSALAGDLRKQLEDLGLEIGGGTTEDHQARIRKEAVIYAKLIKAANITPQ